MSDKNYTPPVPEPSEEEEPHPLGKHGKLLTIALCIIVGLAMMHYALEVGLGVGSILTYLAASRG